MPDCLTARPARGDQFRPRFRTRPVQQLVRLRTAFDRPRLDTVRTMPYARRGDAAVLRFGMQRTASTHRPRWPGPRASDGRQRAGETQFPRQLLVLERRLGHHLADQVVGQPVDPDLAADHLRRLAAKIVQPQAGLDVPQIEFHVPAKTEQPGDLLLRVTLRIGQRGDHDQLLDAEARHVHVDFQLPHA